MAFKDHIISLSLLRDGEKVLHNCSSHWLIHMKLPLLYLMALLIPFIGIFALASGNVLSEQSLSVFWLIYSFYGLAVTCYFFIRTINFELGGCVITNQRVLRFGYRGLSEMIEREILPQKIEDVKVVRSGVMSLFFDSADILIHTSTDEIERLKNVIQSRKIQNVFSKLLAKGSVESVVSEVSSEDDRSGWIDDALGQSHGEVFDISDHRSDTVDKIGDVFRKKSE